MEDGSEEQHPATFDSMPMRWSEQHSYPHSYHGTPAQEYAGFGWGSPPLPMHSAAFSQSPPLRPIHQQLQPLMMPWPSMLGSQQTFYPPLLPQTQIGMTSPPVVTPISAGSSTRSGSYVRKTLSDDDRRRMCKYAEENPTAKQTEIGYLFGVERSTVSKVLRKKEIYLNQSQPKETPRSPPNKRSKARLPDIEKTLSAWMIKEQKKGSPITDDAILEQAYYFASIPGPENPALNPVNIPGWLERFKQKHHHDNRASKSQDIRKDSVADSDNTNIQSPTSPSDEYADSSSPETIFPAMDATMTFTAEDAKPSTNNNSNKRRKSPPSITTAFTDMGSSSNCFTPQLLSPTSPFFSSSSAGGGGPLHSPLCQQGFPALDHFMADSSPSSTSDGHNHGFLPSLAIEDLGIKEQRLGSIDEYMEDVGDVKTINPETLLSSTSSSSAAADKYSGCDGGKTQPTREQAREALEVVVRFLDGEDGGSMDVQEGRVLGKMLGEKLRVQGR